MIITTREGRSVESSAFALTDTVRWGYGGLRNLQTQVGDREIRGIPAMAAAARLRSTEVAKLKLYCWRGEGPDRKRVDSVWQAQLFSNGPRITATNRQQTRFEFWETVEESLSWHNEAYIWKILGEDGRVIEWWALHPAQVITRYVGTDVRYDVQMASGYVDPVGSGPGRFVGLNSKTILAIRGHGQGGRIEADPVYQVFRDKLASTLGRQRHEARMWRRGTALQVAIEFPQGVSKEQADQWRESWRSNYEGTEGETTAVIGGGGTIKPIGMTAADAAFVELEHLTVEDASRIMGVPANLLGAQINRTRPDLEQDLMTWLRFGMSAELGRIEDALYADVDLFGGSQTYPGFDTDQFVRGDILTEQTVLQSRVQAGILTPDEARAILGYDPHKDGLGAIPQITPVGGAPNPLPLPAPKGKGLSDAEGSPDADTKSAELLGLEKRLIELGAEMRALGTLRIPEPPPVEINFSDGAFRNDIRVPDPAPVTVENHVHVAPTPIENHTHVEPTPVTVQNDVAVEPTPVTVENTVNVPETTVTITDEPADAAIDFARDHNGLIKSANIKGAKK